MGTRTNRGRRYWLWLLAVGSGMGLMLRLQSPYNYFLLALLLVMIASCRQQDRASRPPSPPKRGEPSSLVNQALRESSSRELLGLQVELLRLVIDESPQAVIVLDDSDQVQLFNATAESMFDLKEKELVGHPLPEMFSLLTSSLPKTGDAGKFMLTIGQGDNRQTFSVKAKVWPSEDGNRAGAIYEISDITEAKRVEERALRNERLAAIGQMAAGTVHELRNPLAAARGFVQLLGKVKSPDLSPHEFSELALLEIDRMDQILQEYLLLSKAVLPDFASLDLSAILKQTLDLTAGVFAKKQIELVLLKTATIYVRADGQYLQRILQHLLYNAAEATPLGGQINITLERSGKLAVLAIKDSGPGMSTEQLAHCFEPFYSTKEAGIGLGLTVCQRLVDQLSGSLTIDSHPGAGTTVKLCLPTD